MWPCPHKNRSTCSERTDVPKQSNIIQTAERPGVKHDHQKKRKEKKSSSLELFTLGTSSWIASESCFTTCPEHGFEILARFRENLPMTDASCRAYLQHITNRIKTGTKKKGVKVYDARLLRTHYNVRVA